MSRESRRLQLQSRLEEILGSRNVYYQPPMSISMKYPCIVYNFSGTYNVHSDNMLYLKRDQYDVTYITKSPIPDEVVSALEAMPYTKLSRHYTDDNLHHYSYDVTLTERIANV